MAMSKIFRALLLSAAATGAAAFVVTKLQQMTKSEKESPGSNEALEVRADALPDDEVQALTDELGSML